MITNVKQVVTLSINQKIIHFQKIVFALLLVKLFYYKNKILMYFSKLSLPISKKKIKQNTALYFAASLFNKNQTNFFKQFLMFKLFF